jgi:hypothetical protein
MKDANARYQAALCAANDAFKRACVDANGSVSQTVAIAVVHTALKKLMGIKFPLAQGLRFAAVGKVFTAMAQVDVVFSAVNTTRSKKLFLEAMGNASNAMQDTFAH